MAAYPSSLPQAASSREEWVDALEVSYSRAGGVKARRLQSAKKRVFNVEHRFLTDAQKGTLEAFYDANRSVSLTFAWNDTPGTTYAVVFASELSFSRDAGNYWSVTVKLAEI